MAVKSGGSVERGVGSIGDVRVGLQIVFILRHAVVIGQLRDIAPSLVVIEIEKPILRQFSTR